MQIVDINKENESKAKEIQVSDILNLALRNWYWFVISIAICCAAGFAYLKSQPYVYERTATVLINDNSNKGGESAAFEEMNVFGTSGNIANEQLVFNSKRLMQNVVRILRLDVSYAMKRNLRTLNLYRVSPIAISIVDETETQLLRQIFSLSVTPLSDIEVFLSANVNGENWNQKVQLNDTIDSPLGKLIISPTLNYGIEYYNTEIEVQKQNVSHLATILSKKLNVTIPQIANTSIIYLSIRDESPSRAEDILNTLIDEYNEDANNDKNLIAINTSNFIDERLEIIEAELGSVDSDIEIFKRQNRLTDISSETGIYLQSSSQFQQQSFALENQLAIAGSIKKYLNDTSKSSELIPSNTGIADAGIERQLSEYNELLLQRNKLDASDRNPVVMNLNSNLMALRQTIVAAVDNLINGLELRIKNTREQEAQTSRRISQVPTQQKYVLSVERQQKIKESLYLYLLNKREETVLAQSVKENKAKIIDSAYGINNPVFPKLLMIILVSFIIGLAMPILILWLIYILDNKLRLAVDIEVSHLPYLGEIPYKKKIEGIAITKTGDDLISNAFRKLRANLYLKQAQCNKRGQVVMLTSYDKGAGKTFVAKNLAASLAFAEKKIILIDLDFDKNKTGNKQTPGLTDYLAGTISLQEIIKEDNISNGTNLSRIAAGAYDPNATELLFGDAFGIMIDELKKEYDYIILDNIVSSLANVTVVNKVTDITVYVLRYGQFDLRSIHKIATICEQKELNNIVLVLNGVKSESYRLK